MNFFELVLCFGFNIIKAILCLRETIIMLMSKEIKTIDSTSFYTSVDYLQIFFVLY